MKLKSKLMGLVLGVVLLIMFCSTIVVYLLLNKQNRIAAQENFISTINIIEDNLLRLRNKQAKDSATMVQSTNMGDKIKFISEFSGGNQFNLTRPSYHSVVSSMVQTVSYSDLWQIALYNEEGKIIACAEVNDEDEIYAGYRYHNPDETFASAIIPEGVPVKDVEFKNNKQMPFQMVEEIFSEKIKNITISFYQTLSGSVFIETHTPVENSKYDMKTKQMESVVVGLLVSRTRLKSDFAQRIAKLTNTEINIFLTDGKTIGGTISDYDNLVIDKKPDVKKTVTGDHQQLIFNDISVGEKQYLQAILPLMLNSQHVAWISTATSKESIVANTRQMVTMLTLVILICIVVVMPVVYLIATSFGRRINIVVDGLRDIAEGEGDLTRRLAIKSKDELGDLSHWFNIFIEKLQGIIRDIVCNADKLSDSSTDLTTLSKEMAISATSVSSESDIMATTSDSVNQNIASIATAMEQSSVNLSTVASAAEEMTATINEIACNTSQASQISSKAVDKVQSATSRVQLLGTAARKIGNITEVITEISDQTNLLALNANIEASRAGIAGKGFAVVANEIKELANQTASATCEIKEQIEGIQKTTTGTITEIEKISGIINNVNDIVATIASAVEEQSCSTKEISGSVNHVSSGIQEVNTKVAESTSAVDKMTQNLAQMNKASSEMSQQSELVNENTLSLSHLAKLLKDLVSQFKLDNQ